MKHRLTALLSPFEALRLLSEGETVYCWRNYEVVSYKIRACVLLFRSAGTSWQTTDISLNKLLTYKFYKTCTYEEEREQVSSTQAYEALILGKSVYTKEGVEYTYVDGKILCRFSDEKSGRCSFMQLQNFTDKEWYM